MRIGRKSWLTAQQPFSQVQEHAIALEQFCIRKAVLGNCVTDGKSHDLVKLIATLLSSRGLHEREL